MLCNTICRSLLMRSWIKIRKAKENTSLSFSLVRKGYTNVVRDKHANKKSYWTNYASKFYLCINACKWLKISSHRYNFLL